MQENKIIEEEGKEAVTSPAAILNNDPVPTEEDKKDAGFVDTSETVDVSSPEEETAIDSPVDINPDNPSDFTEKEVAGLNTGDTITVPTTANEPEMTEENGVYSGSATQMFTQSQVDEIAGKTRKEAEIRTLKKVFSRYGVNGEDELDDLFGNAQRYDTLKEQYDADTKCYKEKEKAFQELSEQVALLRSGIDENRFEDATFILKGKGLEVNLENINNELATHPEWKKKVNEEVPTHDTRFQKKVEAPQTRLSVLGNSSADNPNTELSEKDIALKKIFKV